MAVTDLILPALRTAFPETASWVVPGGGGASVTMVGRFRTDPWDVGLSVHDGLNATQTWFYVDTRDVAYATKPGVGDYLLIRNEWWEIAQLDADDIGELGYRLVKGGTRAAATNQGADTGAYH